MKCGAVGGWIRLVGPIAWELKQYYIESIRRGISYVRGLFQNQPPIGWKIKRVVIASKRTLSSNKELLFLLYAYPHTFSPRSVGVNTDKIARTEVPCYYWACALTLWQRAYFYQPIGGWFWNNPRTIKRRKGKWSGHILCTNCLLKHVIEGNVEGTIEVRGRRGSRHKQLLDVLKEETTNSMGRTFLEKLKGYQLVKKFQVVYGTRKFITAFTRARQLSLSWAR